jgi:hypothetical protein
MTTQTKAERIEEALDRCRRESAYCTLSAEIAELERKCRTQIRAIEIEAEDE